MKEPANVKMPKVVSVGGVPFEEYAKKKLRAYDYDDVEGIERRQKTDWTKPQNVDDVLLAFPADVYPLMPPYEDIPEEFRDANGDNKWLQFQRDWFYGGLSADTDVDLKDGVDGTMAFRHLKAIQRSFQPKHEHKVAAVAYLASLWFNDITYTRVKP